MDELLNQIQGYIKAYKEPPYGKEVEGTTEILEKASQTLVKTAHRVVLLENQFIDGMKVKYQGDDDRFGRLVKYMEQLNIMTKHIQLKQIWVQKEL